MALSHSPKVVTNGLVFYTDVGNADKSWKGAPTTNLAKNASNVIDWSVSNLLQTVTRTTIVANEVYRITSTSGTGTSFRLYFAGAVLVNGATYTVSYKYKIISGGSLFRANDWCDTAITRVTTALPNGVFYETATGTRSTYNITYRFLDFEMSNNTVVEIYDLQLEQRSFATPYSSNQIRSNTQALLDLTNRNTITATSLTYASYGTFSFDGSSNDITISGPVSSFFTNFSQQITLSTWLRIPTAATWTNGFLGNILSRSSYAGSVGLWRNTVNNQIIAYFRQAGTTFGAVQCIGTIERDVWVNITASWTGSSLSLYVNGVLSQTNTGTLGGANIANWTIGNITAAGGNVGNRFQGEMGVTQIYDRALSENEVSQNFNALKGRFGI